eukprot:5734440-Heterocapsa_arctica.AAC.1
MNTTPLPKPQANHHKIDNTRTRQRHPGGNGDGGPTDRDSGQTLSPGGKMHGAPRTEEHTDLTN